MNEIPIWTIEELRTRYDLEPQLKDVYVEGAFDQEILCECLKEDNQTDTAVYTIECVDIPLETLKQHGFTDGNKQRVLVLARELEKLQKNCSYRCLVDRDFDHWFGALTNTFGLIWTEHVSIELYFLESTLIRDIVVRSARSKIPNWEQFFESLLHVLANLFSIRLADRKLGMCMEWLTPFRCMQIDEQCRVSLDCDKFVERLLHKNHKYSYVSKFHDVMTEWQVLLIGDHRQFIHGHDFIDTLAWVIRKCNGLHNFASSEAIRRILVLLAKKADSILCLLH